jgi:gliding motility-associated-like protein
LQAGQHSVLVRDANGCTKTQQFSIAQPAILDITLISPSNITCTGAANGGITALGIGGTPAYQFAIDGSTSFSTVGTFTGIAAGPHSITIRDANGCITNKNFTLTQPLAAVTAILGTPTNVKCFGGANGQIIVNPTGGTEPYAYLFTPSGTGNFGTNNVFNGLTAGTYTVTVRDANGCTSSVSTPITEPALLETSIVSTQNILCAGGTTGSFSITGVGGEAPYRYSVGGSAFTTNNVFTNQAAGSIPVIVKDKNNCFTNAIVNLTEPTPLVATIANVENIGCPTRLGSVTLTANGGTAPYTYGTSLPLQTQNTIANLAAGTYTVTISDTHACTQTVQTTITAASQLVVNVSSNRVDICEGQAATLTAMGNNGSGKYTYDWGTTIGAGTPVSVSPTATTIYNVTITDASGCTNTGAIQVLVNAKPTIILTGANAICAGQTATLVATGGDTYQWSNGAVIDQISVTQAGIYNVIATSAKGCTASKTAALQVRALPIANAGVDLEVYLNEPFTLDASGAGTNGSYNWVANTGLLQTNIPNPSGAIATATTYVVTVTDVHGCTNTDEVLVELRDELGCLNSTEGITPNDDGFNDEWLIPCLEFYPENTLEIFNRWGQPVYTYRNYYNQFTGFSNGTNLPDGTYYYIVNLNNPNLKRSVYKGTITIIR